MSQVRLVFCLGIPKLKRTCDFLLFHSLYSSFSSSCPPKKKKKNSFLLVAIVVCFKSKKRPNQSTFEGDIVVSQLTLLSSLLIKNSQSLPNPVPLSAVYASSSVYNFSWFIVSNRLRVMSKTKRFMENLLRPFKSSSSKAGQGEEDWGKIAAQEQKHFSFETLVAATKNFHATHKLGQGGFGPVYKGKLNDGREIAVKKLSQTSNQGKKEFINEAKLLARVQHKNVVNLLGYCAHGDEKLLVYEYIQNESLDKLLFKTERRGELDWKRRFEIINGIARGLLYLHEDSHNCIIHRDIKASNILLDDKWVPKIADFGMARLFPEDQTHVNTRVAGTNGYMAPEYVMHGYLSKAADVFSFGVLVLELISGHRNSSFSLDVDAQNLLDWAYKQYKKGRSLEIVDPSIATGAATEQVAMCIQIGLLCTQGDPKLRPDMGRVVVMLSKRPGTLTVDHITRPGVPGSRYRRARRPHGGFSTSSSPTDSRSGSVSATFNLNTSSMSSSTSAATTSTRTSTLPMSSRSDPRGKRPSYA